MARFAFTPTWSTATRPDRVPSSTSRPRVRDLVPPGGAPLDRTVRKRFGAALGLDLARVRIHSGAVADGMARSVDALAYTLGEHVVFRAGAFAPDTADGRHLLAHELAHVAQGGPIPVPGDEAPAISHPHDPREREADSAAARIGPHASPGPAAPAVTRRVGGPAVLHRTAVGGNTFGNWDVDQVPMSAAAAGGDYNHRIKITFEPDAGTVDSPEIAFVQAAQVVKKAGGAWALPAGMDISKRVSGSRWSIDSVTKRGWVGYDDAGNPYTVPRPGGLPARMIVEPGSSPTPLKKAVTRDWPGWNVPDLSWSFDTAAIARRGPDAGTVYGAVTWGFAVNAANKVDPYPVRFHDAPGPAWQGAVAAWNKQAKGPAAGRVKPDQEALPEFKLSP